MPVNSFEDYPMSWKPDRNQLTQPLYISLADLLEHDIKTGILLPDTKLPPQRELADYLDLNVSTITRALKRCEMKGLIYAIVGKGTFVSPNAARNNPLDYQISSEHWIELGPIQPYYQFNDIVIDLTRKILNRPTARQLLEYDNPQRQTIHKQTALKWLSKFHIHVSEQNMIITSGTQNAFLITLLSLFQPGDKIAVDLFTYPNFKKAAILLNIQLVAIENDNYGMIPEQLEKHCHTDKLKGIYLMPSLSNPSAVTMPEIRRKELASLIRKYHLTLIEDGANAFLSTESIPLSSLVPEQFVYLCGVSKGLCAGLQIAFMAFSAPFAIRILNAAQNVNLKMPLLNSEIITELIESGIADEIVKQKIETSNVRNEIYQRYFEIPEYRNKHSFFQWLPLPEGCNGYNFELQAKKQGIHIFCSNRFAVGISSQEQYIRISTCSPADNSELEKGLSIHHISMETQLYFYIAGTVSVDESRIYSPCSRLIFSKDNSRDCTKQRVK